VRGVGVGEGDGCFGAEGALAWAGDEDFWGGEGRLVGGEGGWLRKETGLTGAAFNLVLELADE